MKFVLIFGPAAVGKMTVGKALAGRTGLKLFHNHMSLELAFNFFEFGTPQFKHLSELFRFEIFEQVAGSDLDGLIFTFVWAFDDPKEDAYVDRIVDIFKAGNAETYYVELEASQATRLERNVQEDRITAKPSKKDLERSSNMLKYHDEKYRMNTLEGEFKRPNYIKINNENLSAEAVADQVVQYFKWDKA